MVRGPGHPCVSIAGRCCDGVLHVRIRSRSFPAADENGVLCTAVTHATASHETTATARTAVRNSGESDVDANICGWHVSARATCLTRPGLEPEAFGTVRAVARNMTVTLRSKRRRPRVA